MGVPYCGSILHDGLDKTFVVVSVDIDGAVYDIPLYTKALSLFAFADDAWTWALSVFVALVKVEAHVAILILNSRDCPHLVGVERCAILCGLVILVENGVWSIHLYLLSTLEM